MSTTTKASSIGNVTTDAYTVDTSVDFDLLPQTQETTHVSVITTYYRFVLILQDRRPRPLVTTDAHEYNASVVLLLQLRVCGGVCIGGVNLTLFHIVHLNSLR